MKLKDILSDDLIIIPLKSHTKEEIIKEMVRYLYSKRKIDDEQKILKAILDREKVMSTGVGDRVAIPHGKAEGVKDIVALFGITENDVDFYSIDNKPVRLIFMLVGPPDKTGPHLKALSRISRLMHKQDFRNRLLESHNPREVMDIIDKEEEKYFEI
ncbi:PTS sugar transporter subunit IIA [candidate division KSB1 bacterium]|nr:PTS sugar transporter subunit IIA [candidate division KSB1 bacterium]